jgi:hypothetical protein
MSTTINFSALNGNPVLIVHGPLARDGEWEHLDSLVEELIDSGANQIFIDLSDCQEFDVPAIRPFMTAVRKLRHKGWVGVMTNQESTVQMLEVVFRDDPTIQYFPGVPAPDVQPG